MLKDTNNFNQGGRIKEISLFSLPNKNNYRYLKKTVYVGGGRGGRDNVRIFLFFWLYWLVQSFLVVDSRCNLMLESLI